jgi:hypothetical protein
MTQPYYQAQRLIWMANNGVKTFAQEVADKNKEIRQDMIDRTKPYCGFCAVNSGKHCVVGDHCAVCKEIV